MRCDAVGGDGAQRANDVGAVDRTAMHAPGHGAWCTHADATSGRNELVQHERMMRSLSFEPGSSTAATTGCRYNVSTPHYEERRGGAGGGCLRLHIRQSCPGGGASFRVEALGATQLSLCSVDDHGDGTYSVGCPRGPPSDECVLVRVELGFERYEAFANAVRGGSHLGFMFGKSTNGFRAPRRELLSLVRWCAPGDGARDSPPAHSSCHCRAAETVWVRRAAANLGGASSNASELLSPPPPQPRAWWEREWHWSAGNICADGCDGHRSILPRGEPSPATAPSATLASAGVLTVDAIGESHLGFILDCLRADLYEESEESKGETKEGGAEDSAAGALAVASKQRQSAEAQADGDVAAARSPEGSAAVAHLRNCTGRSYGCWPVGANRAEGEAKRYQPFQQTGQSAFMRRCSLWRPANRSAQVQEPASPSAVAAARTRVCRHFGGNGYFRAALTLRLMISDTEALVAAGRAHPLGEANVLVIQV